MTIRLPNASRTAMADALVTRLDAGTAAGTIEVRSGAQPASANDAATGTLLVTFTLTDPAFAAAVNGVADLDADPDLTTTAAATGTAGWFRAKDSDGNTVFDGSAGTTGADLILNTTSITSGQNVSIVSGTITVPGT